MGYGSYISFTNLLFEGGHCLPVEESEEITKRLEDVERFRRAFADIEDCLERIEWESLKQKSKELMAEFQKTYVRFHQVRSQLRLNEEALNRGDISRSMFEKKLRELSGELSIVDLELDCMKPKLCRFILKIEDFVKEEGIIEDEKEIMDELKEAMYLLSSKVEWEKRMERRKMEKEKKEREGKEDLEKKERLERERKEKEEKERLERERREKEEKERLERERKEKEEKERLERERKEKEEKERLERERREKEKKEKLEGERREKEEKTELKSFCPNCGRENKNESKYCTVCGKSLLKTGI